MYRKYQTNNQAWDEVSRSLDASTKRTTICIDMFGQPNLIGLSDEQRELFWESV